MSLTNNKSITQSLGTGNPWHMALEDPMSGESPLPGS